MANKNRNRQYNGQGKKSAPHTAQTFQKVGTGNSPQATETATDQTTEPQVRQIDNIEMPFVIEGQKLKKSNLILLVLSLPKGSQAGVSFKEMKFREALRGKLRQAQAQIDLLENEYQYLKIVLQEVNFPQQFESAALIEFIETF